MCSLLFWQRREWSKAIHLLFDVIQELLTPSLNILHQCHAEPSRIVKGGVQNNCGYGVEFIGNNGVPKA
jgi:hypothetical protein